MRLTRMFSAVEATAHCDLPCGVYDPAQARIEAESVKAIQEKYQGNEDPVFRTRAHPDQGAAGRAGQAPPVGAVDRLLQAPALREVPAAARAVQQGHQAGRRGRRQGQRRPGRGPEAARPDRRDRHDLLGDQGRGLSDALPVAAGSPSRAARQRRAVYSADPGAARMRLGSAHARLGGLVIDVGALLERVEAARADRRGGGGRGRARRAWSSARTVTLLIADFSGRAVVRLTSAGAGRAAPAATGSSRPRRCRWRARVYEQVLRTQQRRRRSASATAPG